jgi:hypothetical protein
VLGALEWAIREREDRWTIERELLALNAEINHTHMYALLRVNGAKNLGKPLHIDRPWEVNEKKRLLSFGEFVSVTGAGVSGG